MKKIQLGVSVIIIAALLVFTQGCKKEKATFVLTSLGDTTQAARTNFTYDASGKLLKLFSGTDASYDFYYEGDKLTVRTYTSSGTLQNIDSFRYDSEGTLIRIDDYAPGLNLLVKSTTFAYNQDKSINYASVHYVSPSNNDELYNYTYTGGRLTKREDKVKIANANKIKAITEFLAFDDHQNPFNELQQKYIADQFSSYVFIWVYPNNFTSVKQTTYDTSTGDETNVESASAVYSYNSDGLPVLLDYTVGASTTTFSFTYQQR